MLRQLALRNFKSWREAQVRFGKITGFFGANSSGKSSLTQFLLLLKQTKDSTDRAAALQLNGRFVKLGSAVDVIHSHDVSNSLVFELNFSHDADLKIGPGPSRGEDSVAGSKNRAVRAKVAIVDEAFRGKSLIHTAGEAEFELSEDPEKSSSFRLQGVRSGEDFRFIRNRGRAWKLPGPEKTYLFPDQVRAWFQNAGFLSDLEASFEQALDKLYYLGPLREHPQRDYLWARSRPRDVGEKGERTIDAIIAAQAAGDMQNLKRHGWRKPFDYIIAHWLCRLGLVSEFRIEEIAPGSNRWQAKVRTREGGAEVMLTDVGFGLSQVLPVITLLYYVPKGSTVILEQPEIHLHPLAQAELADAIIHAAGHRGVQVILESHSEQLLLRLQRRIAEDLISADDVALYFCEAHDAVSELRELQVDTFGTILNWPDKFMGDAFTETAKAELARLNRMKPAAE